MMDWSNQRYVRVYGESSDELRMGWEGWALFLQILRNSDRAGVLDFDGDDDIPILAARCRMPEDVVRRALPRVLKTNTLVHRGRHLVIPNKQPAQEAKQTDKQRARESRARRRDLALAGELGLTLVTKRDGADTKRDGADTKRDTSVTPGHTVSHPVTSCHPDADADADADAITPKPPRGRSKGIRMRKDPTADLLAQVVTRQVNGLLKQRASGQSTTARKAARRWRDEGWGDQIIVSAIKLRIQEMRKLGNTAHLIPGTLFNTKLSKYVEMVECGIGESDMAKGGNNGHQPFVMSDSLRRQIDGD